MRRREFIAGLGSAAAWPRVARAQQTIPAERGGITAGPATLKRIRTKTLEIAYEESGPQAGTPVLLMHGFPYDPRAYDEVVPPLVAAGCRTIVPYLRGFGPTRFLSPDTPRSGQQGAIGHDLLELMDALGLPTAALVGFDWGGRGACVVAALWPERVRCLVSANGYAIQDIAAAAAPRPPQLEYRAWYQWYFNTERGRAGLKAYRRELCKLLWQVASPNWNFDDVTYERTATSFENPDFVDIVIHSYRHRLGYAPGDPDLEGIEQRLASLPAISVPTIALSGGGDGAYISGAGAAELAPVADENAGKVTVNVASPAAPAAQARFFTGSIQYRVIPVIGHNIPQEAPAAVVAAVLELISAQPTGGRRPG
jgi:pimeloyl-ACP methyl ester carboxylesterase